MVLHRAIQAARAGDLATLRELASSGHLEPPITDAQGAGPVHHAARCGRLECLQFLVTELGLAAGARASNGATPAHDAAATGHIREVQWLADEGGCNIEVSLSTESNLHTQREGETYPEGSDALETCHTCPGFRVISTDSCESEFSRWLQMIA